MMQKMPKIALFTVFYPGAEPYVDDFLRSMQAQTITDFDLIIVNDAYSDSPLQELAPSLRVVELPSCNNIAANRAAGINYAVQQGYDFLMLCDVDDLASPQRLETSLAAMDEVDIVVHDLDIVDAQGVLLVKNYFSQSLKPSVCLDAQFVETLNIFGFSNTMLRVSKLTEVQFPPALRVVDWYYFTLLLRQGLRARFMPVALTGYRQHSNNMIGISSFDLPAFNQLLKAKLYHYSLLTHIPPYPRLYEEMLHIDQMDDAQKLHLITQNERLVPHPLWWQIVSLHPIIL